MSRFPCCSTRCAPGRSEEHTSELQSHSDLVCRLLLEKKNSSNEPPWVSDKRRASAARRWHSSIKWLLCSTVTSASLFRLFYDFIASGSSPQRFVPHGRPVKRRPRGLGSVTQNRAPHVGSVR